MSAAAVAMVDRSCVDIQGRKRHGRTMTLVVMGVLLGNSGGEGRQGLRLIRHLDLALLVRA